MCTQLWVDRAPGSSRLPALAGREAFDVEGGQAAPRKRKRKMTNEKKYESRFEGPSNKGLRAKIRKATNEASSCPQAAAAVRSLADVVALTAQGRATLEQVARDYDPADTLHRSSLV
jgi:hypothetical protein